MGKRYKDAKRHFEKIQYYYDYAGPYGHQQAIDHHSKLNKISLQAYRSLNNQGDLILIQELLKSSNSMMEEMKKREQKYIKQQKNINNV